MFHLQIPAPAPSISFFRFLPPQPKLYVLFEKNNFSKTLSELLRQTSGSVPSVVPSTPRVLVMQIE
jgi:hypothetical protein